MEFQHEHGRRKGDPKPPSGPTDSDRILREHQAKTYLRNSRSARSLVEEQHWLNAARAVMIVRWEI